MKLAFVALQGLVCLTDQIKDKGASVFEADMHVAFLRRVVKNPESGKRDAVGYNGVEEFLSLCPVTNRKFTQEQRLMSGRRSLHEPAKQLSYPFTSKRIKMLRSLIDMD